MTGSFDPDDLDHLLDRALALSAAHRLDFVRKEAADRPQLLRAAEDVLREAATDDGFLDPESAAAVALRDAVLAEDPADEHALAPGDIFGSFEVVEFVGRGGMGEVYRAQDARLGRHVALKVLPRPFVEDANRLARFEREARVLGSLNHPNIGTIYGLAEDAGRQALVLEFVEGTTLASRIVEGPVSVAEALPIIRQIVLALETAHRRGIIHRDLKPANIALTADGTVKVLDFGLAKAVRRDEADGDSSLTGSVMPGAILGTPGYMAPEQVQGAALDHQADIWAFGCILFEILSGVRAFDGDTTSDTLARVLQREPDFGRLPPSTPEPLRRLLRRTLAKDPRQRLADIGDALPELDDAVKTRGARGAAWRTGGAMAAGLGVLLLMGIVTGVIDGTTWWRAPEERVVRFAIPIAASDQLLPSGQQVAALSPDGRTLVYRAIRGGQVRLFRRTIGELSSEPIAGTDNAAGPFFSPDGAWLAFDGDGKLRKVSLSGGAPVTICDAPGGANASWGGDAIVFSTSTTRVLQRVDPAGGTPVALTALDRDAGELAHAFPFVLPAGEAVLFTIVDAREPQLAVLRLATGEIRRLGPGSQGRVASGHLVFVRGQSLWAAGFDEQRLEIRGEPRPVIEGLETAGGSAAHFAIARNGMLVYAPPREEVPERALVWVDGEGAERVASVEPKRYARAVLSPDGRRVALAASADGNSDIWIADLERSSSLRLTHEPTTETAPLWTPDGQAVVFRSDRDGGGIFRRRADGTGTVDRLTAADKTLQTPHGFTPDGRTLLFTEFRSYMDQTIAAVDIDQPMHVRPIVGGGGAQLRPQISRDGRWLAYQSDESGPFEVYVRPFPDVDRTRVQVSRGGGTSPRWSADGSRLYYYDGRGLTAMRILDGAGFVTGPLERLFAYSPFGGRLGPDYDPAPDGSQFLFIRPASDTPSSRVQLLVVQNWFAELRSVSP